MLTTGVHRSARAAGPLTLTVLTSVTALTALVLAGCGTTRVTTASSTGAPVPSAKASSGASAAAASVPASASAAASASASASGEPADVLCPGETPSPSAAASGSADRPDQDAPPNYADNHAFQDAFPLLGQDRCKGLAEVKRIAVALEPLRTAQDFVPGKVQDRLAGLGYTPSKLRVYQNGSSGVSYTVDLAPVCLEGTMSPTGVRTVAHGGYPDGTGCSMPRGGH
ncbi:hypothetical protein [Kitasatospora kifunensis]|uniref:Uncharacterized protein n=1 Tax=Kitasatospora kifunensis TaxID=58351 RepID=A0A7W7QXE0_KITKI|nr:hypothetical protein [Kitasatospora kifunensis]MBB4921517.1 hypothetical protein [Kitasatospora kifunensis]